MQTMNDVASVETIREEYRKLTVDQMLDMIKAIGFYFANGIIDRELNDHLLFQLLLVMEERKAV